MLRRSPLIGPGGVAGQGDGEWGEPRARFGSEKLDFERGVLNKCIRLLM